MTQPSHAMDRSWCSGEFNTREEIFWGFDQVKLVAPTGIDPVT